MSAADADPTMAAYGEAKLRALLDATGLRDRAEEIVGCYRLMSRSWGSRRLSEPPRWSYATADSTPVQFPVSLEEGRASVGISLEAQADPATPDRYWEAGRELTADLAARYGLPLDRLHLVQDLFRPGGPGFRSMAMYHAAAWAPDGDPLFKIYLWAGADRKAAARTCEEALRRLGFAGHWQRVAERLHADDVVAYLSLDLADERTARTKLYIHHRGPLSAGRLERIGRLAADCSGDDLAGLVDLALRADHDSRWHHDVPARDRLQWRSSRRRHWPTGTYLSLVAGRDGQIESAVPQFSLPTLVRNDAEAADLVRRMMAEYGVTPDGRAVYERSLAVFADPPPARQMYAQEFVSFSRRADGRPRTVVYFNPRMFLDRHGLTNGDLSHGWAWFGGASALASSARSRSAKPLG